MLKHILLFSGIALMGLSISCNPTNDDDGDGNPGANTFTFDGNTYTAVDGYIEDEGAVDPLELAAATHYRYRIGISDADFTVITETGGDTYFGATDGVSIVVYFNLFSDGTGSFQTGTFDYINLDTATPGDISGNSFLAYGEVEIDDDNVVENGDLDGAEYDIIGGTVTITGGINNNYTVDFVIETSAGNVEGSFTGEFQYLDVSGV